MEIPVSSGPSSARATQQAGRLQLILGKFSCWAAYSAPPAVCVAHLMLPHMEVHSAYITPVPTCSAQQSALRTQVLVALAAAAGPSTSAAALRAGVQPATVIGLMRDLRGIASATNSKRTYSARPIHIPLCSGLYRLP